MALSAHIGVEKGTFLISLVMKIIFASRIIIRAPLAEIPFILECTGCGGDSFYMISAALTHDV